MLAQTDRPAHNAIGERSLVALAEDRFVARKAKLDPDFFERLKIVLGQFRLRQILTPIGRGRSFRSNYIAVGPGSTNLRHLAR